jgi:hypothetical protein
MSPFGVEELDMGTLVAEPKSSFLLSSSQE